MKIATRVVLSALAVLAVVFLLTHVGAYPWIQSTWWYSVLAVFVALNTIGFATLAAVKLGYRRARPDPSAGESGPGMTPRTV